MNAAWLVAGWLCLAGAEPVPDAGGSPMTALLTETMERLARRHNDDGIKLLRAGDHPAALESFKQAYAFDAGNPEVVNNLGFTFFLLGNHAKAEELYRETLLLEPDRLVAHLNLADLLAQDGASPARLAEAAELLERARELKGNDPQVIVRQARVAARLGKMELAERFFREAAVQREDNSIKLEMAAFFRSQGREDDALAWYRQVRGDAESVRRAEEAVRQMEVERQARRFGWTRGSGEMPERARVLEKQAREWARDARWADAARAVKDALELAPAASPLHLLLAEMEAAQGHDAAAELEYLRALALDPGSTAAHEKLALHLLAPEGHERAAEAASYLLRALQLSPDRGDLNLPLARALRLRGDLTAARSAVKNFLMVERPVAARREAEALQASLDVLLGTPEAPPSNAAAGGELLEHLNRARAFLARSEADAAMAELARIPEDQRGVEVMNLEARILGAAGRRGDAVKAFEASLAQDSRQPEVHTEVALLLRSMNQGNPARAHLEAAERLGSVVAAFELGRMDLAAGKAAFPSWRGVELLRSSLARLQAVVVAGPADGPLAVDARAMVEDVERRLRDVVMVAAALLLLLVLLASMVLRARYGGADLRELIRRHPEVGPEVQRVLSAIRHEVLKHNTTVLTGVVEALAAGQDAAPQVERVYRTVFGDGADGGVKRRFDGYCSQLEQLGRAAGMRLNLERRDPALRAIHQGFGALRRAWRPGGDVASASGRARVLKGYQEAARLLNTTGYEEVRGLLNQLRVLVVDEPLLKGIHARMCQEPALVNVKVEPLVVESQLPLPVGVCIPAAAFEDILTNLMRNGLQSALRMGHSAPAVGIRIDAEVHPVTGHERVVLRVCDRSPEVLAVDVLRGQDIEGGLGFTSVLVGKYDGTLSVETDVPGWSKAVVLKLPREEEGGQDDER